MKVTQKLSMVLEDLDYQVFEKLSNMMKELEGIERDTRRLNNRKALANIGKAHKALDDARMSLD